MKTLPAQRSRAKQGDDHRLEPQGVPTGSQASASAQKAAKVTMLTSKGLRRPPSLSDSHDQKTRLKAPARLAAVSKAAPVNSGMPKRSFRKRIK